MSCLYICLSIRYFTFSLHFYKILQPHFDRFDILCFLAGTVWLICRTRLKKTSFTPILALADVSMNAQLLNCLAMFNPWSLPTTLSSSKSHLLPTNTMGTSSVSFTLRICSLRSDRSLKVDWAVMLYTSTKPWYKVPHVRFAHTIKCVQNHRLVQAGAHSVF